MDFHLLLEPSLWFALLSLLFLEVVLGIDNIVFISIVSGKLPAQYQPKARTIGLSLAMIFRIIMIFGITWILQLREPLFYIDTEVFYAAFSGQSLIILAGGLFLLYKAVNEIHHKLEAADEHKIKKASAAKSLIGAIVQIALLDIVFAFDSILTAIGMVSLKDPPAGFGHFMGVAVMIAAIVISIGIMMLFAGPVSRFVNQHPTIQMLGLSFLILIGVMLLAEGSHLAHFEFMDSIEIGNIPKGYVYFAIFFSLCVEFLNMKLRKKSDPVKLHNNEIPEP